MDIPSQIFLLTASPLPCSGLESLLLRLQPEERAHIRKQKSPVNRVNSLLGRLVVRWQACGLLEMPNDQLTFSAGSDGKPFLTGHPEFQFSISHSGGTVGVAVAGSPVGLDLEGPRMVSPAIVRRFFSTGEQAYVEKGSDPDHRRLLVWTRKEACVKWSGQGLAALSEADTASPAWAGRLCTVERDALIVSLCCDRLPPSVDVVDSRDFLRRAMELTPYPGPAQESTV